MRPPFAKVLVANRGEIACRIFRTLKRLGIASVAVFSEADRTSLHLREADEAILIGPAAASDSYLNIERVLQAAKESGAQAIHPGYGFLSENPAFARACAAAGIVFIGPSAENMERFGLKHRAREAAVAAQVPLLPGTELLPDLDQALKEGERIGFPVMLKSTGGGGGIGMRICRDAAELSAAWEGTRQLAARNFKDNGVYLERYVAAARHIEVQIFGDGQGGVAVLGDRDCSAQRRNQKVVEETPAPGLSDELRQSLHESARRLCASLNYGSAGTVEFVYDVSRNEFSFLEVNTRLQVEHTVTEEVWGVDLVEWMVRQAAGQWSVDEAKGLQPQGAAIQVRLYAEDPQLNFQPSDGLVTSVEWPTDVRVETWVAAGVEVGSNYDPLVAKLISYGPDREAARQKLIAALNATRVGGLSVNRTYLAAILASPTFASGAPTTAFLANFSFRESAIEVIKAGTLTTVQDWPGRTGYWQVGIPPSGPMDDLSFRLANTVLGNPEGAAGLEFTFEGPTLRFRDAAKFCLSGADMTARLDGERVERFQIVAAEAGSVLALGRVTGVGQRAYLAVAGGLEVPTYLGSRATFTLGGFGGHGGRALRPGDVLPLGAEPVSNPQAIRYWPLGSAAPTLALDPAQLRVMVGPQGAPEHFKIADIERFTTVDWEVHFNSSRTGVRLIGPSPDWPRTDGGEAGLHPSNIHDNPYSIGAMDFTGDMPVLLGPDGPSLGGFVCPFVTITADLWKLGQLAPGMKLRLVPVSLDEAREALADQRSLVAGAALPDPSSAPLAARVVPEVTAVGPIVATWADGEGRSIKLRACGDAAVLLEIGDPVLDIGLRLIVQWWLDRLEVESWAGLRDLTPGIRSLHVQFDDSVLPREQLIDQLRALTMAAPAAATIEVASRTVWLPLSWDDPATQLAIAKYTATVRPDAPWAPSNIEFIRRINGLTDVQTVQDIVTAAEYLVLGLGDVYLGAPVATPLDPRQRLVTTKYNPARTWTPENAVGIGGAYLCVYGMEGPGGYQFVGRTVQMWNRFNQVPGFEKPWLLRFFDRVRFYLVDHDELLRLRADLPLGRAQLRIEPGRFSWRDYQTFLDSHDGSIAAFRATQRTAFQAERQRWKDLGLDTFVAEAVTTETPADIPEGAEAVCATVSGSVWKVLVEPGQAVQGGQSLAILESMKMEIVLEAPRDGTVVAVLRKPGDTVQRGQAVVALG